MPEFLTIDDLKLIHATIEQEFPSVEKGMINEGILQSIVDRPKLQLFGTLKQYDDIFTQASSLMEAITRLHPFVDGNKRTGLLSAFSFLYRNGYYLAIPLDSVKFTVKVADTRGQEQEEIEELIKEIAKWLKKRTGKSFNQFIWKVMRYFWFPNLKLLFLYEVGFKKYVDKTIADWFAIKNHPEYAKEIEDVSKFLKIVNVSATNDLKNKYELEQQKKNKDRKRARRWFKVREK